MKRSATQKAAALAGSTAALAAVPSANAVVTVANGIPSPTISLGGPNTVFNWDIDNDGSVDFVINTSEFSFLDIESAGLEGRGLVQQTGDVTTAFRNLNGQVGGGMFAIGPTLATGYQWAGSGDLLNRTITARGTTVGPLFAGGIFESNDNYIGFRFLSSGALHYGWAQLDLNSVTIINAYYESDPNTAIILGAVPEPSSLVLLALGGAGLSMMRRRKRLV